MMKLSDKILSLRKQNGMSQEKLAENLNVSRQAVSRWEMGSALPDANNILQISKLFGVTTDYLLNDHYASDNDLQKFKEVRENSSKQILLYLITLEDLNMLVKKIHFINPTGCFTSERGFIKFPHGWVPISQSDF